MNGSRSEGRGSTGTTELTLFVDDPHSMSERVQSLADAVYKEFERLIKAYDENVVKDLMPLVVAILEGLESSCREKHQLEVDAELLREDNDQLLAQYEKERQLRRIADQKYLVLEDSMEEERKQLQGRLESFESIIRMFEIKLKNSQDQVTRMEEKEQETKKEFSKLHERYTDLLKAHMEFKERVKTLVSANPDPQEFLNHSGFSDFTLPRNFKFPTSRSNRDEASDIESSSELSSPVKMPLQFLPKVKNVDRDQTPVDRSIGSEIDEVTKLENREEKDSKDDDSQIKMDDEKPEGKRRLISIGEHLRKSLIGEMDKLHLTFCEEDGNYESQISVFEEMEREEMASELIGMGDDVQAEEDHAQGEGDDYDDLCDRSDEERGCDNDYSGVSKEIENLIMENNELLETKHALNIVKDDLIAKVDELTGEKEILKDELNTAVQSRERLKARISELEEELKRTREELNNEKNKDQGGMHGDGEEDGLPPGQRKRFTRLEMARVLMERNQYKERLMELQEAVRWAEMVRATRDHPEFGGGADKKRSSIWNFFSNLFSTHRLVSSSSSFMDFSTPREPTVFYTPTSEQRSHQGLNSLMDRSRRRIDDPNSISMPIKGPMEENRLAACGWSLPPKFQLPRSLNSNVGLNSTNSGSIPLPIFCKPLLEEDPNIKILCAAAITWKGGRTPDGGSMVGSSVFYSTTEQGCPTSNRGSNLDNVRSWDEIEKLNDEILSKEKEVNEFGVGCGGSDPDPYHVWVCVDDRTGSHVIVVDVANEGEVLEKFHVCLPNLHCIAGVPGATEEDYAVSPDAPPSYPEHVTCMKLNESDDLGANMKDPHATPGSRLPEVDEEDHKLNLLPTVWMGNIAGSLYIYSADPSSRKRLHIIKLGDSVMSICPLKGKVFVALANGMVACFSRLPDGKWDISSYINIELSQPTFAVRSTVAVAKKFLWCSVANDIFVVDPSTFALEDRFNAHPRRENHVRHMAWMGDGVWVGFRNDSSLKLYHAYTHQFLQDIDVEPCVSKFLGSSKLGFSLVQISCLMGSSDRLWVGTGNGVILSVPMSESYEPGVFTSVSTGTMETSSGSVIGSPPAPGAHRTPGGPVRVYGSTRNEEVYPGSYIPYCSLGQAQLSFHGHKEAVKFFINMPGNEKKLPAEKIGQRHAEIYRKYSLPLPTSTSHCFSQSQSSTTIGVLPPESANRIKCVWIMCGGEGCSDFRFGEEVSSAVDRNETSKGGPGGDKEKRGGEEEEEEASREDFGALKTLPKSDKSHIIVWQLIVP